MARRKWHPETGVNPPFNKTFEDHMGKGELREYHRAGSMAAFYDLYPESRPKCTGVSGCPCPGCCKMRGRMLDRGGRD
jgi:hypothetical protein